MPSETFTFKDLSSKQLEKLKDNYITSKINAMSVDDLKDFVCTIITDQVKGTVGNQEEREAWKEMKDFFNEEFEDKIKDVIKTKGLEGENLTDEEQEMEKRLNLLEKRKEEKKDISSDMW